MALLTTTVLTAMLALAQTEGDTGPGDRPKAAAPTDPNLVRPTLRLTSPDQKLRFYYSTGKRVSRGTDGYRTVELETDTYEKLCVAPCNIQVDPGDYELALGLANEAPVPSDSVFTIDQNTTLKGELKSNAPIRVVGTIISFGGTIAGAGIVVHEIVTREEGEKLSSSALITGIVVGVVSGLVGGVLSSVDDDAEIVIVE